MKPETLKKIMEEVQDLLDSGDDHTIYIELVELKKDLYQKKQMMQDMVFHGLAGIVDEDVWMTEDREERNFDRTNGEKKWKGKAIAEIDFVVKIPIEFEHEAYWEEGNAGEDTKILTERPTWISKENWDDIVHQVEEDLDKWDWQEDRY